MFEVRMTFDRLAYQALKIHEVHTRTLQRVLASCPGRAEPRLRCALGHQTWVEPLGYGKHDSGKERPEVHIDSDPAQEPPSVAVPCNDGASP